VIELTVNGVARRLAVPPDRTLLRVLREELGLTSVREACGVGMCGSCGVLVDGKLMSACLLLAAQVEGREVATVDSLAPGGRLSLVQRAFVEETGFQCSFCTPGVLLATTALLAENPAAGDDEIRDYLEGQICRCGSYVKIVAAVRRAQELLRAEAVGAEPPRDALHAGPTKEDET
jgi:aerobic-type carbon monoxide dehydrogenase small subunit (CoxS/CutS family)